MSETTRSVNIAGRAFALRASQVEKSMRNVLPEPLKEHFIVVDRRRYPPKHVLSAVTGLDRAEFTTHHARSAHGTWICRGTQISGASAGRRGRSSASHGPRDGDPSERCDARTVSAYGWRRWVRTCSSQRLSHAGSSAGSANTV